MVPALSQSETWPFAGHAELGRHLIRSWETKRLADVLLFVGPRALGKGSAAKWLMQRSLCMAKQGQPCGSCVACRQTKSNTHPNCTVLEAEHNESIGIEEIRQAIHQYELVSWTSAPRWLVIVDADRLTEAASNTMLKFLEEIPPLVRVMMTTSQPERVLPTLRSRATNYQWHFVASSEVAAVTLAHHQQVARSAGRPGWLQQPTSASSQQDLERAIESARNIVQPSSAGRDRAPKERAAVDERLEFEELVIRDLLLQSVGSQRRLLWPLGQLPNSLVTAKVMTIIKKYLARYDLSSNLQPRLIYEDLHLV